MDMDMDLGHGHVNCIADQQYPDIMSVTLSTNPGSMLQKQVQHVVGKHTERIGMRLKIIKTGEKKITGMLVNLGPHRGLVASLLPVRMRGQGGLTHQVPHTQYQGLDQTHRP